MKTMRYRHFRLSIGAALAALALVACSAAPDPEQHEPQSSAETATAPLLLATQTADGEPAGDQIAGSYDGERIELGSELAAFLAERASAWQLRLGELAWPLDLSDPVVTPSRAVAPGEAVVLTGSVDATRELRIELVLGEFSAEPSVPSVSTQGSGDCSSWGWVVTEVARNSVSSCGACGWEKRKWEQWSRDCYWERVCCYGLCLSQANFCSGWRYGGVSCDYC